MANKQKLQKNVSKKSLGAQSEKTQRSVHIVKHFQPNVAFNKLHRNCDLPEVNADVDSTETLNKIKKSIVTHAFLGENKKNRISSTIKPNVFSKNERKTSKLDSCSTPLLYKLNTANKLKSDTKHSLTSGSFAAKEYLPSKLNKTALGLRPNDKQINLKKPLLKSSSTYSSTSSKENDSTKAKTFRTNKSKSFSVSDTKKDRIEPKSKVICLGDKNKSVRDKSKRVEDLKKEIRANQLQKLVSPIKDYNPSSRRERVQNLRDEIKKLIDTNTKDKRKYLTELTTEIAEFRTNKNVLIYNVDVQTNKRSEPKEIDQKMFSPNDNETVDAPEDSSKNESSMKSSEKFCGLPVDAPEIKNHQMPVEQKFGSTNTEDVRSIIQVETKPRQCHKCVTTDDVVQSKIEETNKLIENLQKTLDEIRFRTKASHIAEKAEIVFNKTEEAVEIIEKNENKAGGIESEQESEGDNKVASVSDVTDASSSETESLPPHPQAPNTTPEEPPAEIERTTVEDPNIFDEHFHIVDDAVPLELYRPKTRRTCTCRKEPIKSSDKFRTAPEGWTKEVDEFDILQAKLDAIVESPDSDHSNGSEAKTSEARMDRARVSFAGSDDGLFRDFISTGPSTDTRSVSTAAQSVSTAPGSSQTQQPMLVRKNITGFEIPPRNLQSELAVQLLPLLEIRREPVVQKLVNFFIDAQGRTHVTFINEGRNVGFFEILSSSLIEFYSSDFGEVVSTMSKIEGKKAEGSVSAVITDGHSESPYQFTTHRSNENRSARIRKQRSVSESELLSSKGRTDSQQHSERRKVLQSYQLLDDNTRHDPGALSALSLDAIIAIDEDVYKTYINPKGFALQPSSPSTYSAHKPKTSTLEKLSLVKLFNKASVSDYGQKKTKTEPDKLSADSKPIIDKTDSSGAPKLYNIGLYKSTSTQIVPVERRKEAKERQSKTIEDKKRGERGEKELKEEKSEREEEESKEVEKKRQLLDELFLKLQKEREKEPKREERMEKDRSAERDTGKVEEKKKKEQTEKRVEKESVEEEKVGKEELPLDKHEHRYRPEREISAKREGRVERDVSWKIENGDDGKGKDKEKMEEMVKNKLPLDELALKRHREIERSARREERKETGKSGERDKEVDGKRDASSSLVALLPCSLHDIAKSSMSYERISLSISYSTEESIVTESSSTVLEETSEEQLYDRLRSNKSSYSRPSKGSKGSQTFKNLKEKMTKEHAEHSYKQTSSSRVSVQGDEDETSVPNFISGLLDSSAASIKRVIPRIRRSVRVAKSEMRNSILGTGKSVTKLAELALGETSAPGVSRGSTEARSSKPQVSPERKRRESSQATDAKTLKQLITRKSYDDPEEKELRNHNYHVSPVHVQVDAVPTHRRMVKPPEYAPTPLRVGRNGRYQDEENMFCESNSPHLENSLHRRFRAIPGSLYRNKITLDSSNSDTVSHAERASSVGEVRCECSASIGEIHDCRRSRSPALRLHRQMAFPIGEHSAGIRKRRTYFNNWVTYYVNKNALSVNDSSSTS